MKNMIIAGVVGILFMVGGFFLALKLKPLPTPQVASVVAAQAKPGAAPAVKPPPYSIEALRKTSESMMSLNQALQAREQKVAAREQKVAAKESELAAERSALERSHDKFKSLYSEFKQRLRLVEVNQLQQLQKQAALYESMGTTQSIELIRAMDDSAMIKLFSVMEVKPLGKLVAEWKTKYPEDTQRLLSALDGMSQVMPSDKIALADPLSTPAANGPAPDVAAPPAASTADATNTDTSPSAAPDGTGTSTGADSAPPATMPTAPSSEASPAPDPASSTQPPTLAPPPDSTPANSAKPTPATDSTPAST